MMYGMANAQEISTIPEVVEIRHTRKRNTKTVSKRILGSEFNTPDGLKPSPFTKVHQEGDALTLEGTNAEAMNGAATDLDKKFNEWLKKKRCLLWKSQRV